MDKQRVSFTAKVCIELENTRGEKTSTHVATDINLIGISNNLDPDAYLQDGLPTKAGSEALTHCFVQGLLVNIMAAHEKGFRDSAEHLRYVMNELEEGFVRQYEIQNSTFKD